MANVSDNVNKIRKAVYGEEVRSAIADSIEAMNSESSNAFSTAVSSQSSALSSAASAAASAEEARIAAEQAMSSIPSGYGQLVIDVDNLKKDLNQSLYSEIAGGKNLCNIASSIFNGLWVNNGVLVNNVNGYYTICKVEPNKTYTVSKKNFTNLYMCFLTREPVLGDTISGWVGSENSKSRTLTTTANTKYLFIAIYSTVYTNDLFENLMVEENNQVTEYEPYILSNKKLSDLTGNLNDLIIDLDTVKYGEYSGGKNLYNIASGIFNGLWGNTGILTKNNSGYYTICKVEPNKTYTVSKKNSSVLYIGCLTKEPVLGDTISGWIGSENTKSVKITTTANTKYLFIAIFSTLYSNSLFENLMVEENNQVTEYEPYILSNKQLSALNEDINASNAGSHNCTYRGKYLGSNVTDEQYSAISSGNFDGLYIGDYWTINGVNWRIAAFDYFLNTGDINCTTHHAVIVPDTVLYTYMMNDSNTTVGGYTGSKMYTDGLEQSKTIIKNAFSGHVLKHRLYLVNAVSDGRTSAGAWYDSEVELMNEQMTFGGSIFSPVSDGINVPINHRIENSQLPLFAFDHSRIFNRSNWWLRDIVSADRFTVVGNSGIAGISNANTSLGVRPSFCIS